MGETYENFMNIRAHSDTAKEQLKTFKKCFYASREIVKILRDADETKLLKTMSELKERMITGLYIQQCRNGDESNLDKLITKGNGFGHIFASFEELETFLIEREFVHISLGAYLNQKALTTRDIDEIVKFIETHSVLAFVNDYDPWDDTDEQFHFYYYCYGYPSYQNLQKLSVLFPELNFALMSQEAMDYEYVVDVVNGHLHEHRLIDPKEIGWEYE